MVQIYSLLIKESWLFQYLNYLNIYKLCSKLTMIYKQGKYDPKMDEN